VNEARLVRCPSCDGFGWLDEDEAECGWCAGAGYVYRSAAGLDRPIPASDYGHVAARLEALEAERLRDLGYTGAAKKPWEQQIRVERDDGLAQRGAPGSDQPTNNRPGNSEAVD
jgi:hypothetical protein